MQIQARDDLLTSRDEKSPAADGAVAAPVVEPEATFKRRRGLAAGLGIGLLVLDQATKVLVAATLPRGQEVVIIPGFFRFDHVLNDGAAWNILSGKGWLLSLLAAAVLAGGICYYRKLVSPWFERHLAVGAILAGVAGNLVDRLRLEGHVLDFITFHWRDVWAYPSFNVADSAICVGVAVYILSSFIRPEPEDDAAAKGEAKGRS